MRTEVGIDWFKEDLPNLRSTYSRYGDIYVYFWLGTCDLTYKPGRYIYLNSAYHSDANRLIRNLYVLSNYALRQNISLTLLETPIFSIREYNLSVGHQHPHLFLDQDYHLRCELERINEAVREINAANNRHSPKFSLDLQRNRPSAGPRRRQYYTNYKLYRDGIHPKTELSKLWLRKIAMLVKSDCYS